MAKKIIETLSIDLGSSFIKVLVSEKIDNKTIIKDFSFFPSFESDAIPRTEEEKNAALAGSLENAVKSISFSGKLAKTAVSGQSVIVRYLSMPKMNHTELKSAIKYEAEGHIPFNLNEVIMDFQVLDGQDKSQDGKMRVLLVAVKRDIIDDRIKLLQSVGLEPELIDVDSFALVNSFEANQSSPSADMTSALVNIGANMTNINILKGSVSHFSRDIAIAGHSLTKAVQSKFSLGYKDAEKLKQNPGDKATEVMIAMENVVKNLVNEIQLSFDYYENQVEKGIDTIYLSGGCASLAGFSDKLQEKLALPVQIWDSLAAFSFVNEAQKEKISSFSSMFPVAVGLALR
ncbi:type IV pilus assembly protein PilM [PVC group bacterium]|nr:type IV pilus assembly protein PilM [PVC group bacterium]